MLRVTGTTGFVGVMVLLIGVGHLQGDTVFSNFGPDDSYVKHIGYGVCTTHEGRDYDLDRAMPFTVPAGPSYWFTAVDMALSYPGWSTTGNQLDVYLMTNDAGKPGTIIESLQMVLPRPEFRGVYSRTASGNSLLSPGTTYWLAASATLPDSSLAWMDAYGQYGGYSVRIASRVNLAGWTIAEGTPAAFRVLGVLVPEPSMLIVLASGAASLLFVGWRRRGCLS